MSDLISRLQALTEPSREIDAEIALAVYPWLRECLRDSGSEPAWCTPDGRVYAPRYTESIDDALTLIENKRNCVLKIRNETGNAEAWIGALPGESFVIKEGIHKYPAIALLIAIMKAKEESGK